MAGDLHALTIEQKVGQLFFIGVPGADLDAFTLELLRDVPAGGICLFARNMRDRLQTRQLLDELRGLLPLEPLLSVDQEGGRVDRLRRIMTPMPAASRLHDADDARELAGIIAESLRVLGFNMDFAPVVDVVDADRTARNNGLLSRAFGSSTTEVVEMAGGFLEELQLHGVIGCLKHFPGLGASTVDSHEELPLVEIDDATLLESDLLPYTTIRNVEAVMIAHAAYPQSRLQETGESGKLLPASLSRSMVTGLLRTELNFDGLVITDDLEMGAIVRNYGIGEACVMAIEAGCDMLAICASPDAIRQGYSSVAMAVKSGRLTSGRIDASVERIALVKKKLTPPPKFDNDGLDGLCDAVRDLDLRLGD